MPVASPMTLLALQYDDVASSMFSSTLGLVWLAVIVLLVASFWRVFQKAGQPGWAAIIPIYNLYILIKIAGRPGWWLLLMFIPLVNIIIAVIVQLGVAKAFGKGDGFGLGLAFLGFIFYPILAWGDATYHGPPAGEY